MYKYIDNTQLKNEIKAEWTRQGMTQADVAHKCNMTPANLSNIMVNKKSLTFEDVNRIYNALGYDLYIDIQPRSRQTRQETKETKETVEQLSKDDSKPDQNNQISDSIALTEQMIRDKYNTD